MGRFDVSARFPETKIRGLTCVTFRGEAFWIINRDLIFTLVQTGVTSLREQTGCGG